MTILKPDSEGNTSWLPLSGMRILEFGQIYAGPLAGLVLADLGAEVVKIEPPSGDGMRMWPPFLEDHPTHPGHPPVSLSFSTMNRGKKSVSLNLKDPNDAAVARDLIAECDVVLENFRPGTMERLGLGFEVAAKINPTITYCSISGFGQTGPEVSSGAYDIVVQGYSGLMSVTGEDAEHPVKCGLPVADAVAGLYAALSVVAALADRPTRRREQEASETTSPAVAARAALYLDCSMVDSLLAISGLQLAQLFGYGASPIPLGTAHPSNAPYQMFQAMDGPFILAAGNQTLWGKVCGVLGDGLLLEDERFATQGKRVANQRALAELLNKQFGQESVASWLEKFAQKGVPAGPVNTFSQVMQTPHVVERGLIVPFTLECGCTGQGPIFPVKSNFPTATVDQNYGTVPKLGADRAAVISTWLANSGHGQ